MISKLEIMKIKWKLNFYKRISNDSTCTTLINTLIEVETKRIKFVVRDNKLFFSDSVASLFWAMAQSIERLNLCKLIRTSNKKSFLKTPIS